MRPLLYHLGTWLLGGAVVIGGLLQTSHAQAGHATAVKTCVSAATDGKGGPYPAKKSAVCIGLKAVTVNIVADSALAGAFAPSNITIKVGTTVTWHWKSTPHNVVPWHSQVESTLGASFSRTFTKVGTYKYQCTLHPGMNGQVIVVK